MNAWPCPGRDAVAGALSKLPEALSCILYSIADLADAGGAERIRVHLDQRHHPSKSLLQHDFADFQGPAICVTIPGPVSIIPFETGFCPGRGILVVVRSL